jgi:hypothetical protein
MMADQTKPNNAHVEQQVENSGEQVVQPTSTTTDLLVAKAGVASKLIGSREVAFDSSNCQINSINNPAATVLQPVFANITGDLSFRSPSVVTFSPGHIRMQLYLSKSVNDFPDPYVDIDASFGLAVHDVGQLSLAVPQRALESTDEQINVNIYLPLWAEFLFGAAFELWVIATNAQEDVRTKMQDLIQGIVQYLNFHLTPPEGFRMSSVRVDQDNNGNGILETTECPYTILQ